MLTAAELTHDFVVVKFSGSGAVETGAVFVLDTDMRRLIECLTTTREIDSSGVQTFFDKAGATARYTSTPSEPVAGTARETIAEV